MSSSSESGPVDTPEENSFLDGGTSEQEQITARYGSGVDLAGER